MNVARQTSETRSGAARRTAWGWALAIWAAAASAGAAERPLGLQQALQLAEERNPNLLAALARTDAAQARAESSARTAWPQLVLESGWTYTNNPALVFAQKLNSGQFQEQDFEIERLNDPDAFSHLTTRLALQVPLDVLGKVGARSESGAASARAAGAATREARQELRFRVIETYRRSRLAGEALAVTEAALVGARQREADSEAQVEQGTALRADLLRVRARRREREADLAERRADLASSEAHFSRLLGADPAETYRLIEAAALPGPVSEDEATWVARALAERPILEATRERTSAASWGATAEDRTSLPDLGVYGSLQDDRNSLGNRRSGVVGATIRWSAFDASRQRRRAAAEAERHAAELSLEATRQQVRLEVVVALRRLRAAMERHAASMGGAEEGREVLRVVRERRQSGLATLTDELETEAASLGAQLEELRAATAAAIAAAALERAAGVL